MGGCWGGVGVGVGWGVGVFYTYFIADCGICCLFYFIFIFSHRASWSERVDREDGPVRGCLHETESDRQQLPRSAYPGYVPVTHGHNLVNVCV